MSDITLQKVYDEAKLFVQDVERGLDGLIEAIKAHRSAVATEPPPVTADDPTTPAEPEPTV